MATWQKTYFFGKFFSKIWVETPKFSVVYGNEIKEKTLRAKRAKIFDEISDRVAKIIYFASETSNFLKIWLFLFTILHQNGQVLHHAMSTFLQFGWISQHGNMARKKSQHAQIAYQAVKTPMATSEVITLDWNFSVMLQRFLQKKIKKVLQKLQKTTKMSLHLTMIGRATDGLPLCVSVSNEQTTSDFERQGKLFFKKIKSNSPTEGTLQAKNNFSFHYAIRNKVCYLVLTDSSFPKRVAFSYLDDIASEFFVQFGARTDNVVRPYAFIEFDTYIQKSKKTFSDLRNRNQILYPRQIVFKSNHSLWFFDILCGRDTCHRSSHRYNCVSIYREEKTYFWHA